MEISRKRFAALQPDSGVYMTALMSENFKTSGIIIRFIMPLTEERAAAFGVLPFMLEDTCRRLPTITEFSRYQGALYGASVRGGISRYSDSAVISFSASCIGDRYALNGEKITYETLRLLLDCITDPVTEETVGGTAFPQKQFELKRQELIDLIDADINDKRSYAVKQAAQIVYRSEGAGISLKGERAAAAALTSIEAYSAYMDMLKNARVEITFVGSSLPEECRSLISERFAALKRENIFLPEIKPSPLKEKTEEVTENLSVAQCKMVMGFKFSYGSGNVSDPKYRAVSTLFNIIFGGSPFSMLFKNVREKLSLCYYCSASQNLNKKTVFVDSGVEEENIAPAREEILRQLEAVKKGEFTDEILAQSKLYAIDSTKGVNENPSAVSEWYFIQCLDENPITPEDFARNIDKVTREDIMEFANSMKLDTVYTLRGNAQSHETN
ncbi:MAG: insulinase family protein [Oscillospiraceae bacterium]|nr:insulinase family protein [Oscillospiraceae bacterium]